MRTSLAFAFTALVACGGSSNPQGNPDGNGSGDGGLQPPARGFQIKTPEIQIEPGPSGESTYCYYFHAPTTEDMAIKQWSSHMSTGSHHMILFLTPQDRQPPGTLTQSNCGGGLQDQWTYAAQNVDVHTDLPADDGSGQPVGQIVKAGQSGYIQMHYLNTTDDPIMVHVELNATAYDAGVAITPAAPFITFNTNISLAAGSTTAPAPGTVNGTCTLPAGAKFYIMSTHTHKQGVHTIVKDGTSVVFDSTDWEHPGAKDWNTSPFFTFSSGKLYYQCDYMNPNAYQIHTGNSAATDEMCMATGYYFPYDASQHNFCLNSSVL